MAGCFIVFEGIDGSGKSTQARRTAERLGALSTFEPGDTPLGVELRRLLLHDDAAAPVPTAEALLMAADRAQHVHTLINPALDAGRHVVSDRFSGSTLAYQGYGQGIDLDVLTSVVTFATSGRQPDCTILLDCDLATSKARLGQTKPDRLEALDTAFHERVRNGFLALGAAHQWVIIDSMADLDAVCAAVDAAVDAAVAKTS